jgi:hypothetical protein
VSFEVKVKWSKREMVVVGLDFDTAQETARRLAEIEALAVTDRQAAERIEVNQEES